jgi:Protein of unknown function (DUF2865)
LQSRVGRSLGRSGALIALAIGIAGTAAPASAQGLLDALFGGFSRLATPPRTSSFADPFGFGGERHSGGETFGHGTVFCVRTCDGRYFPLQRHAGTTPAEACRSFCPAAKTMVFSGSKIDTAVAQNGARYSDLDSAFAYRDKVVDNCSCNGKGSGLARVDGAADPTLRPGDIVATTGGLATYNGNSKANTGEYTPINLSSSEWAKRLADVKVDPAPPTEKIEPVANDVRKPLRKGRAEASRY